MAKSGYTQFPNFVFDTVMPGLSHSGWKLFCFIWRKTSGWNKTSDYISYSQISKGTGIKGRATIAKAIEEVSQFVTVNSNTGRGNSCEFDITEIINSSEIVINSSENEHFNDVNSSEIDVNSSEIDVNSSENEHTKDNYTKDTNTKNKKDGEKPPPPTTPRKKMPETIPAFKVFVDVTGQYYLSRPQQKIIGDEVGDDPAKLSHWKDVVKAWVGKSYNPRNVTGMLDWFKNGIPQYNGGKKNANATYSGVDKAADEQRKREEHAANVRAMFAREQQQHGSSM